MCTVCEPAPTPVRNPCKLCAPKEKLDETPTPSEVASLEDYNNRRNGGMNTSNSGGSKTRKPKRQKKTLRRNPRKLMSRRQKYSRRK